MIPLGRILRGPTTNNDPMFRERLAETLRQIGNLDPSKDDQHTCSGCAEMTEEQKYAARNAMVYGALAIAGRLHYPHGIGPDPAEPGWVVAYIDLPRVGQVSWHLPAYGGAWDGHSTAEKYARCERYRQVWT